MKKLLLLSLVLIMSIWSPQPGPQVRAAVCPADFTFFGGTRGGGKTECLVGRQIRGAEKYNFAWNGLIVRRKYKEFSKIRNRFDELIRAGLPAERIGGDQQTNTIRFGDGGKITMSAIQRVEMCDDFVGEEFTEISIDECTTFPFFIKLVDKLSGSCRSPHGVPCRMFGTGNPGGPGHNEVKLFFHLGQAFNVKPGTVLYNDVGESRVYIPSFLKDNKILCDNDPKYVRKLMSIRDPMLRRAWLDGDWDVYIGQAFLLSPTHHIIKPIPIPDQAPLYMTFDWGYSAPFSVGWWWVDGEGRIYRFAEWYGFDEQANEGLRLVDSKMAEGIVQREKDLGIWGKKITRLCDPTCMNKKPDYKGGGQGPSTAHEFAKLGILMRPGDPSRKLKIRQFRERLSIPEDPKQRPMMQIYDTCRHFIATIPSLCMDDYDPEDIDSDQHDHCFTGDTLVDTDVGQVPIINLVGKTGRVLTAGGFWVDFHSCRKTRKQEDILSINFTDNRSVKCTPDHKIFTKKSGWIQAKDLQKDDECCMCISNDNYLSEDIICKLESSAKQPKSLVEKSTIFADFITSETENDCIGLCRNISMEIFQKVFQSTTRTMTDQTTILKTLNWLNRVGTHLTTLKCQTIPNGWTLCIEGLQNGTEATMESNGTRNNTKNTVPMCCKNANQLSVRGAVKYLTGCHIQDFVRASAKLSRGKKEIQEKFQPDVRYAGNNSLQTEDRANKLVESLAPRNFPGKSAKVKRVDIAQPEPVYCLIANATHAFSVCGGVLVHNCYDEACHICMARPMSLVEEPVIEKPRIDLVSQVATTEYNEIINQIRIQQEHMENRR